MKILIAEDDRISRTVLEKTLLGWGHDVVSTSDGQTALATLEASPQTQLAILDWMMPNMDGPEVCRRLRATLTPTPVYVILLTSRSQKVDVAHGLDSGADDYLTKPFDRQELRSRLDVGARIIGLQRNLATRIGELEAAITQVKELKGLLPICSYCKKVRDDQNYWQQVEEYVMTRTDAHFSHSICPDCWQIKVEPALIGLGIDPKAARFEVACPHPVPSR